MFARVAVRSVAPVCGARLAAPSFPMAAPCSQPSFASGAASRAGLSTGQQRERARGQRSGRQWHETDNSALFTSGISVGAGTALAIGLVAGGLLWYDSCDKTDWAAVRNDIKGLLHAPGYDDGSRGPLFVRLAWHASGTYDRASGTGGSDGSTMRYAPESSDGANAGLALARELLAPLKKKYPHASFADIWTLAGVVAIEEASGGACKVPWKPGRSDIKDEHVKARVPPNGRLPDAAQGADHVRAVFGRMGFNDEEMVALIGAHALGRCHPDRSGYDGPWSPSPTMFSNDFYLQLLGQKWVPKTLPSGIKQFVDANTGTLMMTPADMAFLNDPVFRRHCERYANDETAFFNDFGKAFGKLLELGVKRC